MALCANYTPCSTLSQAPEDLSVVTKCQTQALGDSALSHTIVSLPLDSISHGDGFRADFKQKSSPGHSNFPLAS